MHHIGSPPSWARAHLTKLISPSVSHTFLNLPEERYAHRNDSYDQNSFQGGKYEFSPSCLCRPSCLQSTIDATQKKKRHKWIEERDEQADEERKRERKKKPEIILPQTRSERRRRKDQAIEAHKAGAWAHPSPLRHPSQQQSCGPKNTFQRRACPWMG